MHKDYVRCLGYAPATETVVSGGLDCNIYLWDVKSLTNLTKSNNTVTSKEMRGEQEREREREKRVVERIEKVK